MDDITSNLPSLQFEAALGEEETSFLPLRCRAHALNVSTCAQATYLVAMLNEARKVIQDRKQSKQAKLLQESLSRDPTLIGIIGCGRLGRQLVESFLAFGRCLPQDIFVSTRRPEAVQDLSDRGVSVIFSNSKVAKSVHVLFISCLPSQLASVSQDIRGCINYSTLVYSLVGVTPISKLCQLLSFKNVLKPDIELLPLEQCSHYPGDLSKDVVESCRDATICSLTCPLEPTTEGSLVKTHDDWVVGVTLTFLNTCTLLQLNMLEAIELVNVVLLQSPDEQIVSVDDMRLPRSAGDELKPFPVWTIASVVGRQPKLKAKLLEPSVRELIAKKYKSVFRRPRLL